MSVDDGRAARIAQVYAELEAMEAAKAAGSEKLPARSRRGAAPSVVFAVRLDDRLETAVDNLRALVA